GGVRRVRGSGVRPDGGQGGERGEVAAGRRAGQAEAVGVDLVFRGVLLHVTDGRLDVLIHLGGRVPRPRPGPRREHRVAAGAEDIEELTPRVVADLATVGIPRTAGDVDDRQAVRRAGGGGDVRQQAGAVGFGVGDVLLLLVGEAIGGAGGPGQGEHHQGDGG